MVDESNKITSSAMSEVVDAEADHVGGTTTPEETPLAESLGPLLTSMRLFGMYFGGMNGTGGNSKSATTRKSRVSWNAHLIYAVVLAGIYWINALRMFSVFTKTRC